MTKTLERDSRGWHFRRIGEHVESLSTLAGTDFARCCARHGDDPRPHGAMEVIVRNGQPVPGAHPTTARLAMLLDRNRP